MAHRFTSVIVTLTLRACRLHSCPILISRNVRARLGSLYLVTTLATKKHCSDAISNNNKLDKEALDKKYPNLHKNADAAVVDTISDIYSISKDEALEIFNEFHKIKKLSGKDIINIITIAKEADISVSMIRKNIPTFVQNMNNLNEKLHCIKSLKDNINEYLPLLNIKLKYLHNLLIEELQRENDIKSNKFRYLAQELQCSIYELCEAITGTPGFIAYSPIKIEQVVHVLKEYNYRPQDILQNLWLFKHNPAKIRTRSSKLQLAGSNIIMKPWIIQCSDDLLQRYVKTLQKETRLTSVYGSHLNILSKRLNKTKEEIELYIKRCPLILEVQLDKINEVLDILLKYGYTAEEILVSQRIFLLNVSLLKKRLKILHEIKGEHRLTSVLGSVKLFEKYVKCASKLYDKKDT